MSSNRKKSRSEELIFRGAVRITSLGCAKNFVDTEVACASFLCNGFALTDQDEEAVVQFVNTCGFLQAARDEASEVLNELKEWKEAEEGRVLLVGGCFVEQASEKELASFGFVDQFIRIDAVEEAGKIAAELLDGKKRSLVLPEKPCYLYDHTTPRVQLTPPHYAYLKIADGCDNCCAYCLIPSIRGHLRSRSVASVVKEAQSFVDSGVKELILIAQDTGGFRRDKDGKACLGTLLRKLDKLKGDYKLRVMYVHPASVDEDLLSALKESVHVIRCLEMPIQHIADNVLKRMGRKVYGERTREVVRAVMELGFAVRTTLMTGFPGETEDDFEELLAYVKETGFERLGVFAYSAEEGTRAAAMVDQIPAKVGASRRDKLLKAQQKISLQHNKALIGQEVEVIVDGVEKKGYAYGRTLLDAPDIDNIVNLRFKGTLHAGDIVKACVESVSEYELNAVCGKRGTR